MLSLWPGSKKWRGEREGRWSWPFRGHCSLTPAVSFHSSYVKLWNFLFSWLIKLFFFTFYFFLIYRWRAICLQWRLLATDSLLTGITSMHRPLKKKKKKLILFWSEITSNGIPPPPTLGKTSWREAVYSKADWLIIMSHCGELGML